MRYPIGYWTVGQRVLWRKPGREKYVPMTIKEIILGECDRPIAARVQSTTLDSKVFPVSFDDFYDPIKCPEIDPRLVNKAPVRVRLHKLVPMLTEDGPPTAWMDGWTKWKKGHIAEIFLGQGGVIGFQVRGSSGGLSLAMAFKSEVEYHEPKPKEKNERIH